MSLDGKFTKVNILQDSGRFVLGDLGVMRWHDASPICVNEQCHTTPSILGAALTPAREDAPDVTADLYHIMADCSHCGLG